MRRFHLLQQFIVLFSISLTSTAPAHTVEQLYMTFEKEGRDWSLNITFDAGYALPEMRDNPDTPQPRRSWLLAQNTQGHERLRNEASKYISSTLTISHGGKKLPYTISFPDYASTPPSFPSLLNGGAYFNMVLAGTMDLSTGGDFSLSVSPAVKPDFVVSQTFDQSKSYKVIAPGSTAILLPSSGTGAARAASAQASKGNMAILRVGYFHVLPGGIDHILFILALFLMARNWQKLLLYSLVFTLAHSLTLGLVSLHVISLSSWTLVRIVEPAIALSIVILAGQNLIRQTPSRQRLLLVFFFGLVHGLGFATSLEPIIRDHDHPLIALLLANTGVELAQASILALALLLTMRWWKSAYYEHFCRLLSAGICATGIFWLVQRLFLT